MELYSKGFRDFWFGTSLIQWVKTFYNNIQSCVINNGYATPFFELRGVRQAQEKIPEKHAWVFTFLHFE